MMTAPRPNFTELTIQVVRGAPAPLPFAEILERVLALAPAATKNPRATVRNAISQCALICSTGDRRYGWKSRLITGSVLRHTFSECELARAVIEFGYELRDALWPARLAIQKLRDVRPVHLTLSNGVEIRLAADLVAPGMFASRCDSRFWDWLKGAQVGPGDHLIVVAEDCEARRYRVSLQSRRERDEDAISRRNQAVVEAAKKYVSSKRHLGGVPLWDTTTHLLAAGAYRHSVPPDPLSEIWTPEIWKPLLLPGTYTPGSVLTGGLHSPEAHRLLGSVDTGGNKDLKRFLELAAAVLSSEGKEGLQKLIEEVFRAQTAHGAKVPSRQIRQSRARPRSQEVFQLRITLGDVEPPIWRRVLVRDCTLSELHGHIQLAMGWQNCHLHQFQVGEEVYGDPELLEYGCDDGSETVHHSDAIRLSDLYNRHGPELTFVYEYDFGDSWSHEIVVEERLKPEASAKYPVCLAGARSCPPEDVGGSYGYQEYLDALNDPDHEQHADHMEWSGPFDPEAFDGESTTKQMRGGLPYA